MSLKNSQLIVSELGNIVGKIDENQIKAFVEIVHGANRVFSSAAGRSGLMIKAFAMRLMHMGKQSYVVSEMATTSAREGDLLVMGSGSGETESQLAIAKKAKRLGVKIALITINRNSSIGKLADCIIEIPASTPKIDGMNNISEQPMGNLFEQAMFVTLESIVMDLMETEKIESSYMFKNHANLE